MHVAVNGGCCWCAINCAYGSQKRLLSLLGYLCGSSLLHCLWLKTRMYGKVKQKAGKQQQENKEIKQNQLVHIHLITIYMNNNVHACMYAAMWLLSLLGQLFVWMLLHDSGSYAILCCIVYVLK